MYHLAFNAVHLPGVLEGITYYFPRTLWSKSCIAFVPTDWCMSIIIYSFRMERDIYALFPTWSVEEWWCFWPLAYIGMGVWRLKIVLGNTNLFLGSEQAWLSVWFFHVHKYVTMNNALRYYNCAAQNNDFGNTSAAVTYCDQQSCIFF